MANGKAPAGLLDWFSRLDELIVEQTQALKDLTMVTQVIIPTPKLDDLEGQPEPGELHEISVATARTEYEELKEISPGDFLLARLDDDSTMEGISLRVCNSKSGASRSETTYYLDQTSVIKRNFKYVFLKNTAKTGRTLRLQVGREASAEVIAQIVTSSPHRIVDVANATGTGNIATTTALGKRFRLDHISIHWGTAQSNPVTISLDATDGTAYDTTIEIVTFVSNTDMFWTPDADLLFESSDEIKVAWTNPAAITYGLRIVCEEI